MEMGVSFAETYANIRSQKQHKILTKSHIAGIKLNDQNLPSGVFSALEQAGLTESVLFSYNDVALRWIAADNWTYTREFNGKNKKLQEKLLFYF